MSTALWLNIRKGEAITSQQIDYFYIYKYAKHLDKVLEHLNMLPLSHFHDTTGLEDYLLDMVNEVEDEEHISHSIPDGEPSTPAYLRERAHWFPFKEGIPVIEAVLGALASQQKMSIPRQHAVEMRTELEEILKILNAETDEEAMFHLEVVP